MEFAMKHIASNPQLAANPPQIVKQRHAIRLKRVRELVPLCESQIYKLIARGDFPKPFQLVPGRCSRAIAWWESDIIEWLEQRATTSRGAK
jgi:predicted DNA-binding transcriptional regulator AlpA